MAADMVDVLVTGNRLAYPRPAAAVGPGQQHLTRSVQRRDAFALEPQLHQSSVAQQEHSVGGAEECVDHADSWSCSHAGPGSSGARSHESLPLDAGVVDETGTPVA